MQIRQISAALDAKLAQLDQQLKQLEEQQQGEGTDPQLGKDIAALQQIRAKLLKSKDIAWRAHQLRDNGDEQRRARQRISGLFLCGVSVVGAVALIYIALQ
jgi:DNA-binding transcriptional MerR regulator